MNDLRSSVYSKAILFMAFVFISLLGTGLRQTWTAYDARLEEAKTDTENLSRSLAQHAQDVFETADAALKIMRIAVAAADKDPAAIQSLAQRMRRRVANQQLFQRLFIYGENGNWIASSLEDPAFEQVHNLSYIERKYFQFHSEHREDVVLVGSPIQTKLDKSWVITITRRISRPDGSFAGVVGASIGLDLFQRFFDTFDIGEKGAISLTDREGTLLIRRPFDADNVGRSVEQGEFFRQLKPDATSGSFEFKSSVDGVPRLGSFHSVAGFDLVMIVALHENEVFAEWRHETQVRLLWLTTTFLFVALLGYRLMLQIRDRVFAETVTRKLQLEAALRHGVEAERQVYERELEEQKSELQRSNAALERFAYAASHDLQSPLRAIAHLAQWIDEDVGASASLETKGNLKLLHGRVARLQMLISSLLAYARVGRADAAADEVDVAAVVHDVVAMLEPRPSFAVECEGRMSIIRTRRTPFELVLKNLISNALQHHDRAEGRVGVAMRLSGGGAEIRISDDGPGIDKRFHEDIFMIFKTLHGSGNSGSGGIGLALVKKQVTDNGGQIWVESAPPVRGTTFVVTWKLATS